LFNYYRLAAGAMTPRSTIFSSTRLFVARTALWLSPLLLVVAAPSQAQDEQEQEAERSWNLGIAVGAGKRDNLLISGDDIDVNYVIDFSWYGKRFFFDNGDFGYTLFTHNTLSINLLGTISNERSYYSYLTGKQLSLGTLFGSGASIAGSSLSLDASPASEGGSLVGKIGDDTFLPGPELPAAELDERNQNTALANRDYAANGGFELLYISPYGDVQAQVVSDVSHVHEGQEAWLSWTKPWFFENGQVSFTMGLEWQSSALLTYYYGVTPQESFSGRPPYEAESGTNQFVRLQASRSLSRHWQVVGMVEREYLSDAIRKSPIVDADSIDTFFTGLYYKF
jgi:outer membrane protein